MKEYRTMEFLGLTVNKCGWWIGNRGFIWSGLTLKPTYANILARALDCKISAVSYKSFLLWLHHQHHFICRLRLKWYLGVDPTTKPWDQNLP